MSMEKDGSTGRRCLKCSTEVTGDNDYCPRCTDEMHKTASEQEPSTLRESIDGTASKFEIPRKKKNEQGGVFDGIFQDGD